jgi:hypothetical protein
MDTITGINPKDILNLDDRTPFLDIANFILPLLHT